jgi:hypothetical protein
MAGPFGSQPGLTSATDTPGAKFILAGNPTVVTVEVLSTTVDAGNTGQTYILRAGLALALITSGTKYGLYATAGAGGLGVFKGFLAQDVNMKGPDGVVRDTTAMLVIGGQPLIDESAVIGLDTDAKADQPEKFLWSGDYGAA